MFYSILECVKMKIVSNNTYSKITFNRALTKNELKDFKNVCNDAQKALNIDDGIHIFKVYQTSLPDEKGKGLGIGKLNSDSAMRYLKFMADYTGSNAVKIYPIGQFPTRMHRIGYYCPYLRSSSVIGEDTINFYKLTTEKYGKLLDESDVNQFSVTSSKVNYENELDKTQSGADFELIKKAYHNMILSNTQSAKNILKEFRDFKKSFKTDSLDRLAIVPYIIDNDRDLFKGINESKEKQLRFQEYKNKYYKEIDIYKFSKFLATKNLQDAKEELNNNGLELYGDCPLGFSEDEVICFPDAFYPKNVTPGWGFRSINYQEALKEGTEANKLFKEKLKWHLENYDGIRFDVGWQYFVPKLTEYDDKGKLKGNYTVNVHDRILEFIEKTAKSVKGKDFDTKKLMYECDASVNDFQMFYWVEGKPYPKFIMGNRTPIITTVWEHSKNFGWGNPDFYNNSGLKNYIIGTNNHDSIPVRKLAESDSDEFVNNLPKVRLDNKEALSKALKVEKSFLTNPINFVKAKFAELFLAKNRFVFFNDVIGNKERLESDKASKSDYRYKISSDYEKEYHTALQEGHGFNLAESLAIAMKAKELDVKMPELYKKVENYGRILRQKGAKTEKEAEKANKSIR